MGRVAFVALGLCGCDCAGYSTLPAPDGGGDGDADGDSDSDTSLVEPPPPSCIEAEGVIELSDPGDIVVSVRAAADGTGRFWVVWGKVSGDSRLVVARRCEPGRGWLEPDLLGPGNPQALTTNVDGEAILIASDTSRFARRWTLESGWGEPETIEEESTSSGTEHVASAASGSAMALWLCSADEPEWGERVCWSASDADGWSEGTYADPSDVYRSRMPFLAASPDGTFLGIWTHCCAPLDPLYWSRFDGAWAPPTAMSSELAGSTIPHGVGLDGSGRGFAFWTSSPVDYSYRTYGARFDGEAFETPTHLFDVDGDVTIASAVGIDGSAFVLYESDTEVTARRFDGESWGAPQVIDGSAGRLARDWSPSHVAVDARGGAVAAWPQSDRVWANRYRPGEGWGDAFVVDESGGVAPPVALTVAPDGTALVVWTDDEYPIPTAAWAAVIPP